MPFVKGVICKSFFQLVYNRLAYWPAAHVKTNPSMTSIAEVFSFEVTRNNLADNEEDSSTSEEGRRSRSMSSLATSVSTESGNHPWNNGEKEIFYDASTIADNHQRKLPRKKSYAESAKSAKSAKSSDTSTSMHSVVISRHRNGSTPNFSKREVWSDYNDVPVPKLPESRQTKTTNGKVSSSIASNESRLPNETLSNESTDESIHSYVPNGSIPYNELVVSDVPNKPVASDVSNGPIASNRANAPLNEPNGPRSPSPRSHDTITTVSPDDPLMKSTTPSNSPIISDSVFHKPQKPFKFVHSGLKLAMTRPHEDPDENPPSETLSPAKSPAQILQSPVIVSARSPIMTNGSMGSQSTPMIASKALVSQPSSSRPSPGIDAFRSPSSIRQSIESTLSSDDNNLNKHGTPQHSALLRTQSASGVSQGQRPPSLKRSSLSSQIQLKNPRSSISSIASSISGRESGTTTAGRRLSFSFSHSASFSFSRRRSVVVGVRDTLQLREVGQGDDIASLQEISRLRETIIALRESKRRRREYLEDDRVLVGTKVSEGHVNYVTAYNMLTGIRVSVSRCNAKVDRELKDDDFTACNKLAFDLSGNELTPSAKYDFKFKDYSPWVFRHLRELFKLDPADYLISLTSKYIVSELGSPGKSGSFFYFSRDYRFIIKTIHHSEHKQLRRFLRDYYNHVKANPNTLISQFYGLHRVKLPFGRKIHFIVMNNLFPPHRDIHRTFDLKGSTLGRRYKPDGKEKGKTTHVLKDLNWLESNEHIKLGPINRRRFLEQLKIDVELLKKLNIMDYSLLIGIHDLTKGNTENIRDSTLQVFEPGANISRTKVAELRRALATASPTAFSAVDFVLDEFRRKDSLFYGDSGGLRATNEANEPLSEIYYLGVIDCLTPYSFVKRIETFWKGMSEPRGAISAVPAEEYGDRFYKFIEEATVTQSGTAEHTGEQSG